MHAFVLLLALVLPSAAAAQDRAATGAGGALPDLSAIERQVDQVLDGPVGRAGKGLVGAAGFAAAVKYGVAAAFGSVSGEGEPILQVNVRGDGSTTDEPATDATGSTATTTATTTATATQ